MLFLGIEASLAFWTARPRAGLPSRSPPPSFAATVIARASLVNSLPRRESTIAFLCLIPAHLECPAIDASLTSVRVHSGGLPPRHAALLADALGAVDHVPGSTAEAAAADDACVAFIGPWRSHIAAQWAPVLNAAGIVQVVPAGTWVGLTRDEPGSDPGVGTLRPAGRVTL